MQASPPRQVHLVGPLDAAARLKDDYVSGEQLVLALADPVRRDARIVLDGADRDPQHPAGHLGGPRAEDGELGVTYSGGEGRSAA